VLVDRHDLSSLAAAAFAHSRKQVRETRRWRDDRVRVGPRFDAEALGNSILEERAECPHSQLVIRLFRHVRSFRFFGGLSGHRRICAPKGFSKLAFDQDGDGTVAEVDCQLPVRLPERLDELVRADDEAVLP
jgi:hypothetical protein